MKRFMGMMPSNEIELTQHFVDDNGFKIKVESGKNGWTITFADYSTMYKDVEASSEDNMDAAVNELKKQMKVHPVIKSDTPNEEISEEICEE